MFTKKFFLSSKAKNKKKELINKVTLYGNLSKNKKTILKEYSLVMLDVRRPSGAIDHILLIGKSECMDSFLGKYVSVSGLIASWKNEVFVYTKTISIVDSKAIVSTNKIQIAGIIDESPEFRKEFGRDICEIILRNQSILPVILYNDVAVKAYQNYKKGDLFELQGKLESFHSDEYGKEMCRIHVNEIVN